MRFQIGPFAFRAVRSDRPLYDADTQEQKEGLAIERGRLLIVSPAVEPARIEEVVRHEHYHAMRFYFPEPTDEEGRAQFVAAIGQQFDRDLEAGGGREALLELPLIRLPRLDNLQSVKSPARDVFGRADRVTCSTCGSETACGSVVNGEPEPHPTTGRLKMQRHFICEGCDTLSTWWEWCDAAGLPTGELLPVPAPRMLNGAEAANWLAMQRKLRYNLTMEANELVESHITKRCTVSTGCGEDQLTPGTPPDPYDPDTQTFRMGPDARERLADLETLSGRLPESFLDRSSPCR